MNRIILGALLFWTTTLWADSPLSSKMETYLVAEKNGQEVMTVTDEASPGDVIEYRLIYTNKAEQPLSGLEITGPIPPIPPISRIPPLPMWTPHLWSASTMAAALRQNR